MKEVKKIMFCLLSISILCGCSYKTSNECLDAINIKLVTDVKDKMEINFKDELTCIEWDSLMLIDRHFNVDEVKNTTGVDLSGYKLMGIKYAVKSDFNTYIAILKNKKIVVAIDTSTGVNLDDFITELNNNDMAIISKEDADFITYVTDNEYVSGGKIYSITFKEKSLLEKYKKPIDTPR